MADADRPGGPVGRVAVLAPHPDDEVLGCTSVLTEHDVVVVHVTDGVPVGVCGHEATALAAAREQEARTACAVVGARVERFVTLDAQDQELWCSTSDVALALVELLPTLHLDAVYAPALQSGHPDHDGLYVAAQLARSALAASEIEWWCYALYALDDRGRPGYGWLHPGLYPDVVDRAFTAEETARKSAALRAFTTQVHAGSVVQSWLDAPAPERFAPMPQRDAPLPLLRSYYDEIFRFAEQGIDRGTVDRVLRAALAGA
ncbi:MAG TPA: PIG-L family deacetylase [Acidimicrobiia bacterium]|jgi:LmbE family N-acetylglucosaminyl deacetylase